MQQLPPISIFVLFVNARVLIEGASFPVSILNVFLDDQCMVSHKDFQHKILN